MFYLVCGCDMEANYNFAAIKIKSNAYFVNETHNDETKNKLKVINVIN